jgi:transcriptional regulator with XRE-family HTH domain
MTKSQRPRIFLREWRLARGLTEDALGELAGGVNYSQLSRYENGLFDMNLAMLLRLAWALKITPNDIFFPPGDDRVARFWALREAAEEIPLPRVRSRKWPKGQEPWTLEGVTRQAWHLRRKGEK